MSIASAELAHLTALVREKIKTTSIDRVLHNNELRLQINNCIKLNIAQEDIDEAIEKGAKTWVKR